MKFQTDSPVFRFLGTLTDFVFLNILFLITCIPIITIGPALSALLAVTMGEARGEGGYILRPYLQAMKENFYKSFLLSVLYFAAAIILLFNLAFWLQIRTAAGTMALLLVTLVTVLYTISLFYVFALSARFDNTVWQSIRNSLLLALRHPKQTVMIAIMLLAAVILFYLTPLLRAFLLLFGFSFIAYCLAFPLTRVFAGYEDA